MRNVIIIISTLLILTGCSGVQEIDFMKEDYEDSINELEEQLIELQTAYTKLDELYEEKIESSDAEMLALENEVAILQDELDVHINTIVELTNIVNRYEYNLGIDWESKYYWAVDEFIDLIQYSNVSFVKQDRDLYEEKSWLEINGLKLYMTRYQVDQVVEGDYIETLSPQYTGGGTIMRVVREYENGLYLEFNPVYLTEISTSNPEFITNIDIYGGMSVDDAVLELSQYFDIVNSLYELNYTDSNQFGDFFYEEESNTCLFISQTEEASNSNEANDIVTGITLNAYNWIPQD